jgi:hypothetical protein
MQIVAPDASSGLVRIVGGGNAYGEPWKQTWEPDESLTYSSSTSYEFWVDDRNWTPCGQYCNADAIQGRNEYPGNETGDWRIEVETPAGGESVEFLTVLHIAPRGDPGVDALHLETTTGEAVAVVKTPGDTVYVGFAKGDGLEGVDY